MRGHNGKSSLRGMGCGLAIFSVLLLAVSLAAQGNSDQSASQKAAQPWVAPPEAAAVKNPVPATPQSVAAGKELYEDNCLSCHGDEGKGDGIAAQGLTAKPANFTDAKMMKDETDGALFWKMSTGKAPMPAWKSLLSETERWQLVDYIRTFAKAGGEAKNSPAGHDQH